MGNIHSYLMVICFGLVFTACGGGSLPPGEGGEDSPDTTGVYSANPTNYLVYSMTESINQQERVTGLSAVDLNDFENQGVLDMSGTGDIQFFPIHFQSGNYDASSYTISHYHASHILYTKDGHIFGVPVFNVNAPDPLQLGNENSPGRVCVFHSMRGNDYLNPENSRLIYKVAANPGQCDGAGEWHMVSLSSQAQSGYVQLPAGISQVLVATHDDLTASMQGWIVVENGMLVRYDTNFQTSQAVSFNGQSFTVNDRADFLIRTAQKQFVIKVDQSLYLYDPASNQIVANIFQAQSGFHIHRHLSDGSQLFVTTKQNDGSNTSNLGASNLFSVQTSPPYQQASLIIENTGIGLVRYTDNYLYYTADVDDEWIWGKTLKRISKGGGQDNVLMPVTQTRGVLDMYTQGQNVFIEYSTTDSTLLWTLADNDSQGVSYDAYHVVGITYDHMLNPAQDAFNINYLVVLDRRAGQSRGVLRSINVLTRQVTAEIGQLEAFNGYWNNEVSLFWARGHNYGLFNVYVNGIKKLFFYDAEQSQSMQRIDQNGTLTLQPIYQKTS